MKFNIIAFDIQNFKKSLFRNTKQFDKIVQVFAEVYNMTEFIRVYDLLVIGV